MNPLQQVRRAARWAVRTAGGLARMPRVVYALQGTVGPLQQTVINLSNRLALSESILLRMSTELLEMQRQAAAAAGTAPAAQAVRLETNLQRYGGKTHSQNDEDGIITYLTERLIAQPGYFVEFGVGPRDNLPIEQVGLECNSRLLQDRGWQGLYMDGNDYPESYGVRREIITALNINDLLDKYNVPAEPDIVSIDIDGQDFWVWLALQRRPRIVIIEYNPGFHVHESCVIPLDTGYRWDATVWYGASLLALHKLAQAKGYVMVYANGVNAFMVRRDLLANPEDFPFEAVWGYRGKLVYHRPDPLDRTYLRI